MMMIQAMPLDVLSKIYGFDGTYREIYTGVMVEIQVETRMRKMTIEKGYTVSNWHDSGEAVVPRYIDAGKVYGSFIRHGKRTTSSP